MPNCYYRKKWSFFLETLIKHSIYDTEKVYEVSKAQKWQFFVGAENNFRSVGVDCPPLAYKLAISNLAQGLKSRKTFVSGFFSPPRLPMALFH